MMQYDPRHAPEHIVANLAANMPIPRPRYPGGDRTPEQHLAFAREIANRIWVEAYAAGAAYGLSIAPARAIIIQAEPTNRDNEFTERAIAIDKIQRDAIRARIDEQL